MANAKISALTELTSTATGDLIPIVDVSDTTDASSGTTKRVTQSNLVADRAPRGTLTISTTGGTTTLTSAQFQNMAFDITGVLASNATIIIPDGLSQMFIIDNETTGAFTLTVKHSATAGTIVTQGSKNILYTTGSIVEGVTATGGGGGAVTSVFGRTGAVTASAGDYTVAQVTNAAATTGTLAQFAATTSAQLAGVISDETGSGALVFATSPTLVTPTLGIATATSINKVTITAPATGATLTLVEGSTLATSGAFSTTLTATAATNVTLPTTGTLATLAGTETLTNKTISGASNTITNVSLTTGVTGTLPIANGGTNGTTAAAAYNNLTPTTVTATDGATITFALASGTVQQVTLAGNRTVAAPTGLQLGMTVKLAIIQDATGSRTLTWNAVFDFPGGVAPVLTTTASAMDVLSFTSFDGTNLKCTGFAANV